MYVLLPVIHLVLPSQTQHVPLMNTNSLENFTSADIKISSIILVEISFLVRQYVSQSRILLITSIIR